MDEQQIAEPTVAEVPAPTPESHRLRNAVRAVSAAAVGVAGAGITEVVYRRKLAASPEWDRLSHPLQGMPARPISADGTQLYAEVFGPENAPTFVLGPGWTETLYYFDALTRVLTDNGFRVVAYDLRGQGRSAPSASHDWDLDRYGDDLEAVLELTCPDRNDVIVAGHSMGAMSIAAWARRHDVHKHVRAAALMNTGFKALIQGSKILPGALPDAIAEPLGRWAFMGNPLPAPHMSTLLSRQVIRYMAFGPHATDAEVAFYERMFQACPGWVRASAGKAMTEMDLFDGLDQLTVPTLVLSGSLDRLTPPAHAERIAAALPELTEIVELPGIGHMGPLEAPYLMAKALLRLADRAALPVAVAA